MTKAALRVVTAGEVDAAQLDRFLRGYFSEQKCDFLRDHGLWRHRDNRYRLVVLNSSNQIVGYCAAIPTPIWLLEREIPALFWVDLYVPPEWRGRGIQSLTDQVVHQMADLNLGFPNKFVVPIHRKHGWGVREDCRVMLLPLVPSKVIQVHIAVGWKGLALRSAAWLANPAAWLCRHWLERYEPVSARIVEDPDAESLAVIFRQHREGWITTNRTTDWIRWRYLESPHRSQYTFFTGGSGSIPSLVVVSRTFIRRGVKVTRFLDIFGDLGDRKGLSDVLRLAVREAAKQGASQVTAKASHSALRSILLANGFLYRVSCRLRWFSRDPDVMRIVGESRCHWVLADSDSDTVD